MRKREARGIAPGCPKDKAEEPGGHKGNDVGEEEAKVGTQTAPPAAKGTAAKKEQKLGHRDNAGQRELNDKEKVAPGKRIEVAGRHGEELTEMQGGQHHRDGGKEGHIVVQLPLAEEGGEDRHCDRQKPEPEDKGGGQHLGGGEDGVLGLQPKLAVHVVGTEEPPDGKEAHQKDREDLTGEITPPDRREAEAPDLAAAKHREVEEQGGKRCPGKNDNGIWYQHKTSLVRGIFARACVNTRRAWPSRRRGRKRT